MKKLQSNDITIGIPIPFPILDENGVLLYRSGSVINMPTQIVRLIERGAMIPEINESNAQKSYQELLIGNDSHIPFEHLSSLIINLKHVLITTVHKPDQIDVTTRIEKIARAVQEVCARDIDGAIAATILDTFGSHLVVQQMMGAVITEIISRGMGVEKEDRLSLVCAALTRDLGFISIQCEQGESTDPGKDNRAAVREHPNLSEQLLNQAGVSNPVWLQTVREHHERLDGSGYPAGLQGVKISIGCRILAVADTYGVLTDPRAHGSIYTTSNALKLLYSKKDIEFDEKVVRLLISTTGLMPPGTIVRLASGEIAAVKSPIMKSDNANVYSIYGRARTLFMHPVLRKTNEPENKIVDIIPFSECQSGLAVIRKIWGVPQRRSTDINSL